jgi:UDP-2,3-diacylglucosamine hydrolase
MLEFLRHLRGRAGSLVINGDLFEFWFEWRHVLPRAGFRVAAALADLRESGIPVMMLAGNHDCWGGPILEHDVGLTYLAGPWRGDLAGWTAHVEHGDGLRPVEDRTYRRFQHVLRHPWAIGAFRWLHPDIATALARRTSHTSRAHQARDGGVGLRRVAEAALGADETLDLVVYGHSHVAGVERVGSRGGVYGNAGCWLDAPTFLRVTPERIELRRWDGSVEGTNLDALDRVPQKALTEL